MIFGLHKYVVIAAITLASAGAAYVYVYNQGGDSVRDEIEEQNDEAQRIAIEAARDRGACVVAGGVWDFASSKCGRDQGDGGE